MTFLDIARQFAATDSGSDAFKAFYRDAFQLMRTDPGNAAHYFVVGVAALSFVRRHEDQPITANFADEAKATLERFNKKILQALDEAPSAGLALLGEVALDYQFNVQDF